MKIKEYHLNGCGCPECEMAADDFILPTDDIEGYASGYELAPNPDEELHSDMIADPDFIASIVTQVMQQLQGGSYELEELRLQHQGGHSQYINPGPPLKDPCGDVIDTLGGYAVNPGNYIPIGTLSKDRRDRVTETKNPLIRGIQKEVAKLFQERACREHIRENVKQLFEQNTDGSEFGSGVTPEEEAKYQQFLKDNPNASIGDLNKNPEIYKIWMKRASKKGPDAKYISGNLDNATIGLEDKVHKNVEFEEEDVVNTGRMAYDEPIVHQYIAKVDGVTFTVETESFGPEGEREVQWDTLEAEYETTNEGSCGYTEMAPGGQEMSTPGDTQGMAAYSRTNKMANKMEGLHKISKVQTSGRSSGYVPASKQFKNQQRGY